MLPTDSKGKESKSKTSEKVGKGMKNKVEKEKVQTETEPVVLDDKLRQVRMRKDCLNESPITFFEPACLALESTPCHLKIHDESNQLLETLELDLSKMLFSKSCKVSGTHLILCLV